MCYSQSRSLSKTGAHNLVIILGWKGLMETNSLTYYEHLENYDCKKFVTLCPGVNVIKLVSFVVISGVVLNY